MEIDYLDAGHNPAGTIIVNSEFMVARIK